MKKIFALILVTSLGAALLTGCSSRASASMPEMGGMMEEEAISVETVSLSRTSITNTLTYSGTIDYEASYSVVPDVSGKVTAIYYEIGDTVQAGSVLFEIDDQEIQDNIQQLNASLQTSNVSVQQAQTRLEQLDGSSKETQLMTLNTNISNAEKSLENAKIALTNAESSLLQTENNLNTVKNDYTNAQVLYSAGALSQTEMDSAKNSYEAALNSYETAQRSVEQARISLQQAEETLQTAKNTYDITVNQTMAEEKKSAQESLDAAIASRNAISVQLQQAQQKLARTKVTSPVSGVISQKNVELGATVSTATTAFTIVNDASVSVKTSVTEQLVDRLQIGDQVTVLIKTLTEEALYGAVASISPVTDSSGTYPVTVEIDNSQGNIKSGMFAEITFDKEKNDNTMALTKDAVLTDENGSYVYIVVEHTAQKVYVETGIDNGQQLEILSGLTEGDEVVVKGQNQVYDGSQVQIIETSEE